MFDSVIPLNINKSGYLPSLHFPHGKVNEERLPNESVLELIVLVFSFYMSNLLGNQKVLSWFRKRKIHLTPELIDEFKLGFADRGLGKKFPRILGRQSELIRGNLQKAGLLKPSGFPFFASDAVAPLLDMHGQIQGAYGRRITTENRHAHRYHNHWDMGDAVFFNIKALKTYKVLYLCKSPLEALTLICAGVPNVISTMGIYCFDQRHIRALEQYAVQEVAIALDNTDVGNQVSGMVSQALESSNIQCSRLPLPRNQDVNAFAQAHSDHVLALKHLVEDKFPVNQSYENLLNQK